MTTKKIKITTQGPLEFTKNNTNCYLWGPVLTPYNETTDTIFTLLTKGIKVVEIVDDEEIVLTLQNYMLDNSKAAREDRAKVKTNTSKKKNEPVKVQSEPVEEVVHEEPVVTPEETEVKADTVVQEVRQQENYKKKNYNNNHR